MAMRYLIPLLALATPSTIAAQPFAIGTTNLTFIDDTRGGRAIACEVAYPAQNAGTDVPVAPGIFPVVVLGHGFVMTVGAYANFREALVPEGYVLVLPTTEGGLLPNHSAFGTDLAFCVSAFQTEGADNGSLFFGHIATSSALMGHSMGGGAAILGAASSVSINAVVCFAPAETNPSAIAAAGDVDVPLLILAGSQDCVTPPNENQLPMYLAAPTACKAYVEIVGGGHCNFANSNFNCSFGELTCGGGGSLGREAQQALTHQYTLHWLDRFLKDDVAAGDALQALLDAGDGVSAQWMLDACPPAISTAVVANEDTSNEVVVAPIPMRERAELRIAGDQIEARFRLVDQVGRVVRDEVVAGSNHPIERAGLSTGTYLWIVDREGVPASRGKLVVD